MSVTETTNTGLHFLLTKLNALTIVSTISKLDSPLVHYHSFLRSWASATFLLLAGQDGVLIFLQDTRCKDVFVWDPLSCLF